jgi:uncharacterized protein (TIRG00374 family)
MNLKVWLGVIASLVLLWLAVRDVDFAHAWDYIRQINLIFLIPYGALLVGEVFIRGLRWYILLAPIHRASYGNLCSATLIGLMANNILPARAGEFVRAYAGARMERIPFSTCFATVVIDRVLDGLTVSALFVPTVLLYPELPDNVRGAGYVAAGIYVATLTFLIALMVQEAATLRFVATLLRLAPRSIADRIMGLLEMFVSGLTVLRRGKLVLAAVVISFLVWAGYAGTLYFMALAFEIHLGFAESFVVLLILTIALTLPTTPGFVGAMEWAIKVGLVLFGIDASQAFAFAIVYHVTQYVPLTLGGFVAAWLARLSMGEIAHVQSRAESGSSALGEPAP